MKNFDILRDKQYVITIAETKVLFLNDSSKPVFSCGYIYDSKVFTTVEEARIVLNTIYNKYDSYIRTHAAKECNVTIHGNEYRDDKGFFVVSKTKNHYMQVFYQIQEVTLNGQNTHGEYFQYIVGER